MKYEYMTYSVDESIKTLKDALDRYGKDGWRLVQVLVYLNYAQRAILERPYD